MDKKELLVLKNILNNPEGLKFISILLRKLGAFDRGINFQNSEKEIFRTVAKREQGLWLLDCCYLADATKFTEILHEHFKEV